jgi:enoyl-CoA hydratase/carnithine racemase
MTHSQSPSADAPVLLTRDGAVAILRLNRPDNRNSMTPELLEAFAQAVRDVRAMPDVRCVVVTGTGACFSAGADFRSQIQTDHAHLSSPERSAAMYEPFLSLGDVEVPVLGALQGHAVGGGFGLSLMTDMRIVASDAKYGANFARLGLHAGMAISYLLPRLTGVPRACELLFTGRLFSGTEGAAMGLFLRAVPTDQVLPETLALAQQIAQSAPIAVRMMKKSIYQGLGWDPRTAAWREAFAQAATVATDDAKEGVTALLAKRPPQFQGK